MGNTRIPLGVYRAVMLPGEPSADTPPFPVPANVETRLVLADHIRTLCVPTSDLSKQDKAQAGKKLRISCWCSGPMCGSFGVFLKVSLGEGSHAPATSC